MGLLDHFAACDWNGDGIIDSWDDALQLQQMLFVQEQMEAEAREYRISRIVAAITRDGEDKQIGNEEFEVLCWQERLSPAEFEQSDIDEIQRRLNSFL